jgi:hypothetical protein
MSEEQKPRKTWIMYKKVCSFEDFNVGDSNSIIPIFDITNTASDKYGIWTLEINTQEGYDFYKIFNHNLNDA